MADNEQFFRRLNQGPAILFLGQEYLKSETGADPLLAQIQKRSGASTHAQGYNALWDSVASNGADATLSWVSQLCQRVAPPDQLKAVAEFAWHAVFSSAVDPIWLSAFRNDWRDVAAVYDDEYFPKNPRDRRELHCTYLFGSVTQSDLKLRPPLSNLEFAMRRMIATNLLQRLPDVLTPLGTLVIDGYDWDSDWLNLPDFYPILQSLGPGQVHCFGVSEVKADDQFLAELLGSGKVVLHRHTLSGALTRGRHHGLIKLGAQEDLERGERRITLRNGPISVPKELWNNVSRTATILDDAVLAPASPISDEALYWEFRRFLFESSSRPLWTGYSRGLAFQREFEDQLQEVTLSRLARLTTNARPIIVHGQTGTGKTVALGALAHRTAALGAFPTIFVGRKSQRPSQTDIDRFCQWFEDQSETPTLIVWDGMVDASEYYELQGYLASRGRNAVVVGSTYKLEDQGSNLIAVPDQLSSSEAEGLLVFLQSMHFEVTSRHREMLMQRDPNYLVALYRLLPPTRSGITTGVVLEYERLQDELLGAVNAVLHPTFAMSGLAAALLAAGIIDEQKIDELHGQNPAGINSLEVSDLIDVVTVPGRFGLSIPIELLARTCGTSDFANLAQVLRGFDLVHAYEDTAGRIVVAPRHRLEAQLVVQAKLGDVQEEVGVVCRIIEAMRKSAWPDENDEIDFVIDLLREVGPRGDERPRFASGFRDLASALANLRETRNFKNPRLMLQEAHLLREWVVTETWFSDRPSDAQEVLEKAQAILDEALDMLGEGRGHRRLRTFISTEIASALGASTMDALRNPSATTDEAVEIFDRLLESVRAARTLDFSAYNPVDVLAWSTLALARSPSVDESTRMDAIVDTFDALNTVDEELLEAHNARTLSKRKYEVSVLLGDDDLSEAAFQNLIAKDSAAGYYIRAMEISGDMRYFQHEMRDTERIYDQAWEYLESHRVEFAHDNRCLNLLFDYWWQHKTGHRLFEEDRLVLPFDHADWQYALGLIKQLRESGSYRDLALLLVEAIGLFHTTRLPQAMQLFREVERNSDVLRTRRRIQRIALASDAPGKPALYHGNVRWVDPTGRRGGVYVDELRLEVPFIPVDFRKPNIRRNEPLGEFHIAFSFLGPIADLPV